ncbi:MAG: hypothetical protein R3E68_21600 [Burkholderiaceae bacterium]
MDAALLALQGQRRAVLAALDLAAADLRFMQTAYAWAVRCRLPDPGSGYTGEDGYEISVPVAKAHEVAGRLLAYAEPSGRSGWRGATACAWKPACRCTATTSGRHHADRGGPAVRHSQEPAHRRRQGRRLSRRQRCWPS